jgi:hypothetical protein
MCKIHFTQLNGLCIKIKASLTLSFKFKAFIMIIESLQSL